MAIEAKTPAYFALRNVNMKTIQTVTIIPARTGRFLARSVEIIPKTLTGTGVGATVCMGTDSPGFSNVLRTINDATPRGGVNFPLPLALPDDRYCQLADLSTSGLVFNIIQASTYTSELSDIFVLGTID